MSDKQTKAVAEPLPAAGLIEAVSIEQLADVLRAAGYRVTVAEQNGVVQLMSASQGIGFSVRFGNVAQGFAAQAGSASASASSDAGAVRYLDYTHSCVLQVQGDYPPELVSSWNRTKRFARLADHGPFLALEMDVIVGGGVTENYLRSTIELWDRLIQEFLMHLRNRPALAAQQTQQAQQAESRAATVASAAPAVPPASATAAGDVDVDVEEPATSARDSDTRARAIAQ